MALVLGDRVLETSTTSGTGTLSLLGASNGYNSFATGVGNGNTTFYCIYDPTTFVWEIGIGTYTTSGSTLSRTTVLSNSSGTTSLISFASNIKNVFSTYPSEKGVWLDASGNATALGTPASVSLTNATNVPVNQATGTLAVANGGTGTTASTGGNSVVLRDSNVNVSANNFLSGYTPTTSAGGTTVLTAASSYIQRLTGSSNQTYQLPNATTLAQGTAFIFDNDSTGTLTIVDSSSGAIDTVPTGGVDFIYLVSNGTSAGTWTGYAFVPDTYDFNTATASFGSAAITNATWNGSTIGTAYGGTGLTAFAAGTNYVAPGTATTFTAQQSFAGSTSVLSTLFTNAAEVATVSATAATGTINFYTASQGVLYYTSNASGNWVVNIAHSSGTTMNSALGTGQAVTVVFLVTQGSTAYYNTSVQVDGTTSGVTTKWQGGAPTSGNTNGIDVYSYTVIKTASATYTVLASVVQFA